MGQEADRDGRDGVLSAVIGAVRYQWSEVLFEGLSVLAYVGWFGFEFPPPNRNAWILFGTFTLCPCITVVRFVYYVCTRKYPKKHKI